MLLKRKGIVDLLRQPCSTKSVSGFPADMIYAKRGRVMLSTGAQRGIGRFLAKREGIRRGPSYSADSIFATLAGNALSIVALMFGCLPTRLASRFGAALGARAAPRLFPRAAERVSNSINLIDPSLSSEEVSRRSMRLWRAVGSVHAEIPREHRIWEEGRVQSIAPGVLAKAKESGRPLIVAGLHTGNWELLPIAMGYAGHNIVQVYQPQSSPAAERVVRRARLAAARAVAVRRGIMPEEIFKLVPPTRDAGLHLLAAIRSGWTAMIFVDDDPGGQCVTPNLFGDPAMTGNLGKVGRLARLASGIVVPAFVERLRDAHFAVHFLTPIDSDETGDVAMRLNTLLADAARRLADQWFMLPNYRPSDPIASASG